jgi:hypothetical protein
VDTQTCGKVLKLKEKQVESYHLLQQADTKQILSFLSGEGGMGEAVNVQTRARRNNAVINLTVIVTLTL